MAPVSAWGASGGVGPHSGPASRAAENLCALCSWTACHLACFRPLLAQVDCLILCLLQLNKKRLLFCSSHVEETKLAGLC